jgi:predicted RNase H-like nuclease (RuvC/YqgF family)
MLLIYDTEQMIRDMSNRITELTKKNEELQKENEELQKENEHLKKQISIPEYIIIFTTYDDKYLCLITCNSTDKIISLVNKFYGVRKEMENLENFFFLDEKMLDLSKGVEYYGIKHGSVIKVNQLNQINK